MKGDKSKETPTERNAPQEANTADSPSHTSFEWHHKVVRGELSDAIEKPELQEQTERLFCEGAADRRITLEKEDLFKDLFVHLYQKYCCGPYQSTEGPFAVDPSANINEVHEAGKIVTIFKFIETKIIPACGGWQNCSSSKVLDLGCGSVHTMDGPSEVWEIKQVRYFEPWFCRALHALGFNVTGVDINNNDVEDFTSIQGDLRSPKALKTLPEKSFDCITSMQLNASPTLKATALEEAGFTRRSSHKAQMTAQSAQMIVSEVVVAMSKKLIKPGGTRFLEANFQD